MTEPSPTYHETQASRLMWSSPPSRLGRRAWTREKNKLLAMAQIEATLAVAQAIRGLSREGS